MMYLYFIQAGEDGPIKIGITRNPEVRLANLQVSHFETLHVRAICAGGSELETELHAHFASGRLRGEWFKADTPGLAELIEQVQRNPPETYVSRREWRETRERIESRASKMAKDGRWDEGVKLIATVPPEPPPFGGLQLAREQGF